MRNTLYRQMVYCINAYRTWIEVADDNLYKEHIISRTLHPGDNRLDELPGMLMEAFIHTL